MVDLPVIIENPAGLKTLYRQDINETYHSQHGAIQESMHVFIEAGMQFWIKTKQQKKLSILEIGFGTGLNAILSLIEADKHGSEIHYTGLETLALPYSLISKLGYQANWDKDYETKYAAMHTGEWEGNLTISTNFELQKRLIAIENFETNEQFNLVYFDAFAPDKQSELWDLAIFQKIFNLVTIGGVLVTYSAKGDVRRNLIAAGFEVEKLDGPPHKRHMLRAVKMKSL